MRDRGVDELPFVAQTGIYGSAFSLTLASLILIAEFWVALFPIGSNGDADVKSFFQTWLFVPIVMSACLFYMVWKKNFTLVMATRDIDVDTGRGTVDLMLLRDEIAEEKAYLASRPLYYRIYKTWC
ncbi:unnamed protein product [Ambrosiozyma monospora]|uniref:Unnamed protein product n=1 Tax=Ambrosiozyma monospora TaxID=43982 RepID=A0ACB5TSF2_AMBMO|nr:unnamed protein product [Ambrosiozyma monospora]